MARRRVAGLISGTSMDGLDMAIVEIAVGRPWEFSLIGGETAAFSEELRQSLRRAHMGTVGELTLLDDDLGRFFATALEDLAGRFEAPLDAIGSHGQTIFHEHRRATLQIGEPGHLALTFGCPVVSDFRRADIVAGGCGAPLAPILDQWALASRDHGVLALNLGGIANFTALPPAGETSAPAIAFDTGPANMVMDGLARRFTEGRSSSDIDGTFASRGKVRETWLEQMLTEPYFAVGPPKSCGDGEFGEAYLAGWVERLDPRSEQEWYDLFATAAELSAATIAQAYDRFVRPERPVGMIVASGGGIHNPELMRRLRHHFAPIPVETSMTFGVDPDFKEAIAFAVMASARLDGIPANLPDVTGAGQPVLLGKITEILPQGDQSHA